MEFEILDAEALKALDADALRKYIADALAAARAILAEDDVTQEAIDNAQAIVDSKAAAEGVLGEIEAKDAERLAKAKALRDALGGDADEDADEDEADEAETDGGADAEAEAEEEALVASTRTVTVPVHESAAARAARLQEKPKPTPKRSRATLVASADVPGLSAGQTFDSLDGIADGTHAVLASLARARGSKTRIEKSIATVSLGRDDDLVASRYPDGTSLMAAAANEQRLAGATGAKGLVAAGGWCAPSETLYDLCGEESRDGLFQVPSVQVDRGGLNFTKGPQFSAFYAGNYFNLTEAQVIGGTEKECVTIPCPTFTDVRLEAFGVCIEVPILTEAAYPELVQRWISGTLVAHDHRRSMLLINKALAIAGSAVTVANPWPTASGSVLAAVELVVLGERQRWRLSFNETLEAVFPFWIKAALRADLSIRTGVDMLSVTDQQIESWFAARGIRPQFVYGWQPLTGTSSGAGPVIDFPSTLEILVYPAGALVQGTKDVITLNGVYDSVGLATNNYTALFTEEGISLMNPCREVRRVSLNLQVTGLTAAALINQDWGTAATTPAAPPTVVA